MANVLFLVLFRQRKISLHANGGNVFNRDDGVVGLVVLTLVRSSVGVSGSLLPSSELRSAESERNFLNTENVNADLAHRALTVPGRSRY